MYYDVVFAPSLSILKYFLKMTEIRLRTEYFRPLPTESPTLHGGHGGRSGHPTELRQRWGWWRLPLEEQDLVLHGGE